MNIKKIEVKSQKNVLRNSSGMIKDKVDNIKIMNSLGDGAERTLEKVINFDLLLVIDTGSRESYCAGYIRASDIKIEDLDLKTDGATLKNFPMNKVTFIYVDMENKNRVPCEVKDFPYFKEKREMQKNIINRYK